MIRVGLIGTVLWLLLPVASARPVSYVGGWTVIAQSNRQATSLWTHYTVNPNWSIGWRSEWDRALDFEYHGGQATWLARRWFGENYQGNVYAIGGVGAARGRGSLAGDVQPAVFTGLLADWETRRWFTSYSARVTDAGQLGSGFFQSLRLGFAPYVANTGALHTWLMLELDHRPTFRHAFDVTPLVRLFKGGELFETGWREQNKKAVINFTYRL
ncbi:MAG: hypothetical protein AB8G17_14150 [Gammaproteobacteria bacterium]